jgi:hypothetical protein
MKKLSIIVALYSTLFCLLAGYSGLKAYTAQQIRPSLDNEINKIETISISDPVAGGTRVFVIKETNARSVKVILEGKTGELQKVGPKPEDFVKIVNPVVALLKNGLYKEAVSQIYNFCELADSLVRDHYEKRTWDAMKVLMQACSSLEGLIIDKFKVRKYKRDRWLDSVRRWNLRYGAVDADFYKDQDLDLGAVKRVNAPISRVHGKFGRKKVVNKHSARVDLLDYLIDRKKKLKKLGGEDNAKRRDLMAEIAWVRKILYPERSKKARNAHW